MLELLVAYNFYIHDAAIWWWLLFACVFIFSRM
jgi:hypothetical protein